MARRRRQRGGNFPVFRGRARQHGRGFLSPLLLINRMQRGHGLGGMFRGLLRTVTPHLKKGLAYAGKRALTAGANALSDVSEGTSIKDALKNQARNEFANAKNEFTNNLKSINRTKRKGSSIGPKKKKRKLDDITV